MHLILFVILFCCYFILLLFYSVSHMSQKRPIFCAHSLLPNTSYSSHSLGNILLYCGDKNRSSSNATTPISSLVLITLPAACKTYSFQDNDKHNQIHSFVFHQNNVLGFHVLHTLVEYLFQQ